MRPESHVLKLKSCPGQPARGQDISVHMASESNAGGDLGLRNSNPPPDQAIRKLGLIGVRSASELITLVSFSPDNVQETGVSPGGRSRFPIVAAEAEQVERTRRKTWTGADPRFLCPTGTVTGDIATFAMSCTPGSDPWAYTVYGFRVGRAQVTVTARAPEPNYPGEYSPAVTISAETRLHRAMPR
jgi:hypothetical protein